MQFPKDAEAAKISDEFMLGDELLAAPFYDTGNSRSVYLPMGIWTRLSDNQVFPGKRVVKIAASGDDDLPLFCRTGTILPVGSNPTRLHYFPRLGAEFFLFESDLEDYSQVHAAPAGDFLRLEIESRKDRDYEWVVHHIGRPRKIEALTERANLDAIRAGGWYYDARQRNLHVRMFARAGEGQIVNISVSF
jgi:alpha-glucosidase (family GH31 glycosyl hydrolase)